MFVGYRHCKKCGKPLMGLFDGAVCDECEKAEQEPKSIIREAIEDYVCNYLTDTAKAQKILNALQDMEHEPIECDDAISRQAVLSEKIYTETEGWSGYTVDADYIERLPPVTQKCEKCAMNGSGSKYCDNCRQKSGKWIPVSEPPKELGTYLIQTDGEPYMCQCRWTDVNPFWTDLKTKPYWNIFDLPQYSKVIAWMPLPEPYEPQESEANACKDCYYNDGEVHAECVICDKAESEE